MLRGTGKINLLCYKQSRLPATMVILPALLNRALYVYNGKKYERLYVPVLLMCFFYLSDFILVKKIGPIHGKKDTKKLIKGKKR
jgi:ribosomal protein S19